MESELNSFVISLALQQYKSSNVCLMNVNQRIFQRLTLLIMRKTSKRTKSRLSIKVQIKSPFMRKIMSENCLRRKCTDHECVRSN